MTLFQTENLLVEDRGDAAAVLWLDLPEKKHNVLNRQVLADLDAVFDFLAKQPNTKRLSIASKKASGFMAGADLHEFAAIASGDDARSASEAGQRVFEKLANLPQVTVAVIHGPCLGGGLELALACDYRVAVDQPGTQIGLPELDLGLIPGWGGTQRLPRVVGLEPALRLILQRQRLNAREALRYRLVDKLALTQDQALAFAPATKTFRRGLPLSTWRQRLLESTTLGRALLFRGAQRIVRKKVPDDMPAPAEALNAIRVGVDHGMAAGLHQERDAIARLAGTSACRNLMGLFFQLEHARRQGETSESASAPIRTVGVVGAGVMGAGIAQLAVLKGFEVIVQEINDAALAAGLKKIEDLFRKVVERGLLTQEEADRKLAALGRTTSYEGFEHADLVIEAAIEDLDKKRAIFRELDRRTRPDAILATNTSSLSVRELQEGLEHRGRVAGLHFFNPVHKMPLVEVVRTPTVDETVISRLAQFASDLGKTPVVVGDGPGFVVNRILMPYLAEAILLAGEGCPVDRIDRIMRRFGMPMGPLELLDQVGLDVAAHISRSAAAAFDARAGGPAAQVGDTFRQMVQRGWLGQKSGRGFYVYKGKRKQVHAAALAVLPPSLGRPPSDDEARDRMVLGMVNEAAACLGEGLAADADAIDLALVLGTGWAPHRGGPLHYAAERGLAEIVRKLEDMSRRWGPRFEPSSELRRLATTREAFANPMAVPVPI